MIAKTCYRISSIGARLNFIWKYIDPPSSTGITPIARNEGRREIKECEQVDDRRRIRRRKVRIHSTKGWWRISIVSSSAQRTARTPVGIWSRIGAARRRVHLLFLVELHDLLLLALLVVLERSCSALNISWMAFMRAIDSNCLCAMEEQAADGDRQRDDRHARKLPTRRNSMSRWRRSAARSRRTS